MLKKVALVLGLFALSLASLSFNVAVHELGHFAVAEYFGLNPKINFESGMGFIWNSEPIAYTSYAGGTRIEDIFISVAGPLANFSILILSVFFYRINKNFHIRLMLLALIITAALSIVSNMFPSGGSDGEALLALI